MNVSKKLALGAAAMALTIGGAVAVSTASAEPREAQRSATNSAWAKVRRDGVILGWSGFNRTQHLGIGRYALDTTVNIDGCALLGTVNTENPSDPGAGSSSITVGESGPYRIYIRTATPSAGGSAAVDSDRSYSVSVVCP
ncbi:hypothetical protein [Streptomyces sp. NBC_00454]|uniref:hypothetical protein n=1 Tax=Streptomyces sp. NBC_00454 TaxID=2975747 RepID=UPI0030E3B0CD